ncbi:MAG: hypothetical protein L0H94_09180 [Nitrospira sp.]|nr:hypothetical protein [Nitrospira sp.]
MKAFQPQTNVHMKTLTWSSLVMAIVVVALVAVPGTRAEAQSPSTSPPSMIVRGEVSQVEGKFHMTRDLEGQDTLDIVDKSYVMIDRAGKEMRLELRDDTKVLKRVNPGDTIEARISSEGHTLSVTRLEP